MEKYTLTYYNCYGEECHADFHSNEYHNLMELLFDKYIEDWGDCKGRAWCGTCHIKILNGTLKEKIDLEEKNTLSKIIGVSKESRLACQIPVNKDLNHLVFRILGDGLV